MKLAVLLQLAAIPVTGGIVLTWLWGRHRERGTIAMRLARWAADATTDKRPFTLLKRQNWSESASGQTFLENIPGLMALESVLLESGLEEHGTFLLLMFPVLVLFPAALAMLLGFSVVSGVLAGVLLLSVLLIVLKTRADLRRTRFCEQLPDAIDLMVAVLRSGHSVPQAIRAVAQEVPNPCGQEFALIFQRMNLGQPLPDALVLSSRRFRSYELDLMQRAVSIQVDVGGSLADLLEKTNMTLRQRLKLARQLKVITSQSRLSALIVGMLPIVLAVALNFMNPGYLQLLVQDKIGQLLLCLAVILELAGVFILRRMSTMKV